MVIMIEDLKDGIIEILSNPSFKNKKYKFSEIKKKLIGLIGAKKESDVSNRITDGDIKEAIHELFDEGKIYIDDRNKNEQMWTYRIFPKDLGYVYGTISINKYGEGIIKNDKGRVYHVPSDSLGDALDGDTVIVIPKMVKPNDKIIGKVKKIIKRKDGKVLCEVSINNKGEYYLKPIMCNIKGKIVINSMTMNSLVEGDRIQVRISSPQDGIYYAGFIKVSSHKDDPDRDLKDIATEHKIEIDFSPESMEEVAMIPNKVSLEEMEGRIDCRDEVTFSIDGIKTKDRDDALSIKMLDNGNYRVCVHIADVTHYVYPGMALYKEALERSTSVYMADSVIPMLPHKLSNGICSLNPNEDRLTFSCIMEISPDGEIVNYDFEECVINSDKAMTYNDVNDVLETIDKAKMNGTYVPGEVPEGVLEDYKPFVKELMMLDSLSKKLNEIKEKRGYTDYGSNDLGIDFDEDGNPVKFYPDSNGRAGKLIENFMLLAGECAANYLVIPTPYRVHEGPSEDRVEETFELLEKSGIRVIGNRKKKGTGKEEKRGILVKSTSDVVNGKVIQGILKQISDMETRDIVANILVRMMSRARYDTDNKGHFGLALPKYVQFTSPIRRGEDFVVHRNIKLQKRNEFDYSKVKEYESMMSSFANHASFKEREADSAERQANVLEMVKYMNEHIGEKFNCRITFLNNRCIFVKTVDGIEGILATSEIFGDTFVYDDERFRYRGRKSKTSLKIGTQLVLTSRESRYGNVVFGMDEEDVKTLKLTRKGA